MFLFNSTAEQAQVHFSMIMLFYFFFFFANIFSGYQFDQNFKTEDSWLAEDLWKSFCFSKWWPQNWGQLAWQLNTCQVHFLSCFRPENWWQLAKQLKSTEVKNLFTEHMFQEKLNRLSIENLLCDVLGCQELKLYHVVIYYDWCYFLGAQKNKTLFEH